MATESSEETKTITIRVPVSKLNALKQWASDNGRSMQRQIVFELDNILKAGGYVAAPKAGRKK